MMKKLLLILSFSIISIFALISCDSGKMEIEDHEWKMRYIMHGEDDILIIDAAREEDLTHPEVEIISMNLIATDGKITITDITNGKIYEGSYTAEDETPDGTNYEIIIDGKQGYAVVAMTTYADGSTTPTLPISLGNYALYFYADPVVYSADN